MMQLQTRIDADGITATATIIDRPLWADFGSTWWKVTLRRGRKSLAVPFGMGEALTHEPTAAEVLDCLASDAAGYDNAVSFEDWADEYGLDMDDPRDRRKHQNTYTQVKRNAAKLRSFLADDYDDYLYGTDGL